MDSFYESLLHDHLYVGNPPRLTNRKANVEAVMHEIDLIDPTATFFIKRILDDAEYAKEKFYEGKYAEAARLYKSVLQELIEYEAYVVIARKSLKLPTMKNTTRKNTDPIFDLFPNYESERERYSPVIYRNMDYMGGRRLPQRSLRKKRNLKKTRKTGK